MCNPAVIISGIGLILSASGTGYSISEGMAAKEKAKDEAGTLKQQQHRAKAEAEAEMKNQRLAEEDITRQAEEKATMLAGNLAMREEARSRGKSYGAGKGGRRGTILTSPLGYTGTQATTTKSTLLGA